MGENSNIEWTHHRFNPWRGCEHSLLADGSTHPGCEHVFAIASETVELAYRPAIQFVSPQRVQLVGKKAAGRELDARTWDEFPLGAEVAT